MNPSELRVVTRRFLLLRATRWLPTGLVGPILVLLLLDRGLSLGQIGVALSIHGLVVFVLELPTGGLADAIGRRPVLLAATAVEVIALVVLLIADSVPFFIVVFGLQGLYRALESGPLDSWYVDAALGLDPDADIQRGLARGGLVLGVAAEVLERRRATQPARCRRRRNGGPDRSVWSQRATASRSSGASLG